jgi:hypothetical protein
MLDILSYLPGKRKQSSSGWISFNAPCCVHNGENADKRSRGGLKVTEQGWSYHCFNCNYTASFTLGRTLSLKARRLLQWLGVDTNDIERINLESLKHKSIAGIIDSRKTFEALADIKFEESPLPDTEIKFVGPEDQLHWDYIQSRCVPDGYPFMMRTYDDGVHWTRPHVIVPFTHNDVLVGHSCRFLDGKSPKYINDMQPGYVFGTDLQHDDWQYAIVVEGLFDALSINGLAVMHNTVNDAQARLIRSLGKEVVVVPDQDLPGLELIDRAVELNWAVSIPPWPDDIKDVNDAVQRYGRVATLLSILEHKQTSKIKIELARRDLKRRLSHE